MNFLWILWSFLLGVCLAPAIQAKRNRKPERVLVVCGKRKFKQDAKIPQIGRSTTSAIAEEVVAGIIIEVVPQIGRIAGIFDTLAQVAAKRASRYAPIEPKVMSPEEYTAFIESKNHENQERLKAQNQKLVQEHREGYADTLRNLEDTIRAFLEFQEDPAVFKARREKQNAEMTQILFENSERKEGRFPKVDIVKFRKNITEALFFRNDVDDAMAELWAIQKLAERAKNPAGKEQIEGLLREFLNDQGLVSKWVSTTNILLETPKDSKLGLSVREYFNRTLMREALGNPHDQVQWDLLLRADYEASQRLLNRAIKYYDYSTQDRAVKNHRTKILPEIVRSKLSIDGVDANTFEGSEIIEVAQQLAKYPQVFDNEFLRFHAATALKTAKEAAGKHELDRVLGAIDRAWAVVDYASGVLKGLSDFAKDSVANFKDLVLHPIDSAEALYYALVHYDKTYDAIKASLENIWDDYDTYSVDQKGELHAKIAGEIVSAVFPLGTIKNITKASRIAKAVELVVGDTKKLARIGKHVPAPKELGAFPNIQRVRSKTSVLGGGKLRGRWKDSDGKIYEWDYQHGTVELYDKRGKHLGEFDPDNGEMLKSANLNRTVEP